MWQKRTGETCKRRKVPQHVEGMKQNERPNVDIVNSIFVILKTYNTIINRCICVRMHKKRNGNKSKNNRSILRRPFNKTKRGTIHDRWDNEKTVSLSLEAPHCFNPGNRFNVYQLYIQYKFVRCTKSTLPISLHLVTQTNV